jgi:hypothetical protein
MASAELRDMQPYPIEKAANNSSILVSFEWDAAINNARRSYVEGKEEREWPEWWWNCAPISFLFHCWGAPSLAQSDGLSSHS